MQGTSSARSNHGERATSASGHLTMPISTGLLVAPMSILACTMSVTSIPAFVKTT